MWPVQTSNVHHQLDELVPYKDRHSVMMTQQEAVQCAPYFHFVVSLEAHPLPVDEVLRGVTVKITSR